METESDQGDVPRVGPVDVLPRREPLMDQVPPGEQTAVQRDVGDPREPADMSQKSPSHYCNFSSDEQRKATMLSGVNT